MATQTDATVSMLTNIPESLYDSLQEFLEDHEDWDHDRAVTAAISLFLLQNGEIGSPDALKNDKAAARVYLNTLFKRVA